MLELVLSELFANFQSFGSFDNIPEEFSCKLFWKLIESDSLQDDLLFFISHSCEFQVCRNVPNQRPSLEIKVDWTTTLILNLLCQMNFQLRISSCTYKEAEIAGISNLVIEESASKKVFASPLQENVDNFFGEEEKPLRYSFPDIYFNIQDFETCFDNMKLGPEGILIVELFCSDNSTEKVDQLRGSFYEKIEPSRVLFQGAVSHKILLNAHKRNSRYLDDCRGSFIMMKGPDGVGEAQLNVIEPIDSGGKGIKKFKNLIFGNEKLIKTSTQDLYFNCRLTFIRLHWKSLLELLLTKRAIDCVNQ